MRTVVPNNEAKRLEALQQYKILDTEPEAAFDDLTRLAAQICETPIALISLVDSHRQWFKSKVGLSVEETSRDIAFCAQAILEDKVLIIEDTLADPRFAQNPLVTTSPRIRFYAGAPLINQEGLVLGTLCVIDYEPRALKSQQVEALQILSRQVITQMELHRSIIQLTQTTIEYRQAEEVLLKIAAENRRLARAVASASDGIIITDPNQPDNPTIYTNPAFERITGYKQEEIIGRNCRLLQGVGTDKETVDYIRTCIAERREVKATLLNYRKDGQPFWNELKISPVLSEDGDLLYFVGTQTDITEKKQLEVQFLRNQRMESIGTLAGGIAHDLNNVLAPIMMAVQLLEMKSQDESNQQWLEIIENNAKRGADLVKQVLSFARGIEGERKVLQVKHLIREIKQIAQKTFPKSIKIYINVPQELWTVSGDATQLHQVLMNLCVNARDAMPNGGTLSIVAENCLVDESYTRMNHEAQVGSYIVIKVSDTGTGIAPEILDRVFEPFFTTKEVGKGTGLGLSTVMGIVKSHGGWVNVTSDVGKGTQFKVYLPAAEITQPQPVNVSEIPKGNGELILVVDDETAIREITKTTLETYDYKVITASDGIKAISLYAEHKDKIRGVIVDMMMPSMDGAVTIRILRKINPQVQIMAVSGLMDSEQLVADVKNAGVTTFLAKPYTTKELLKTLNGILASSNSTSQIPNPKL